MFELVPGSDSEKPITVFVPMLEDAIDYPLRVADVLDTLAVVEDRSKKEVLSDIQSEMSGTATAAHRSSSDEPSAESVPVTGKL
jgi:hypothetical protein